MCLYHGPCGGSGQMRSADHGLVSPHSPDKWPDIIIGPGQPDNNNNQFLQSHQEMLLLPPIVYLEYGKKKHQINITRFCSIYWKINHAHNNQEGFLPISPAIIHQGFSFTRQGRSGVWYGGHVVMRLSTSRLHTSNTNILQRIIDDDGDGKILVKMSSSAFLLSSHIKC